MYIQDNTFAEPQNRSCKRIVQSSYFLRIETRNLSIIFETAYMPVTFLATLFRSAFLFSLFYLFACNSGLGQRESLSFISGEIDEHPGLDSIAVYRSSGSMMSWRQVSIKSNALTEPLEMGYTFFYSNFSNPILIPQEWQEEPFQSYHSLVDSIFGFERKRLSGAEPDLRWLLDAFTFQEQGDSIFHRYFNVPLQYQKLPMAEPVNGWYPLPDSAREPFLLREGPEQKSKDYSEVWLDYQGHNHFLAWKSRTDQKQDTSFQPVWKSGNKRLWRTAHGLLWQQGDQYAWVFVSSGDLMGGPQKLRWESLVQAQVLEKRYVLLHQAAPVIQWNQLFLIDTQTGRVGDIRLDEEIKIGATSALKFKLKKGQLIIQRSESKYVDESYEAILDWKELKRTLSDS